MSDDLTMHASKRETLNRNHIFIVRRSPLTGQLAPSSHWDDGLRAHPSPNVKANRASGEGSAISSEIFCRIPLCLASTMTLICATPALFGHALNTKFAMRTTRPEGLGLELGFRTIDILPVRPPPLNGRYPPASSLQYFHIRRGHSHFW